MARSEGKPAARGGVDLTVSESILAFWRHAQRYYRKADGTPTSEVAIYKQVLRVLRRLYGHTLAKNFGPLCLKAVMSEMVTLGWCRKSINSHVARVKHVFKWAGGNEMVPPSVHHGLTAVSGFARGRSEARESVPVRPISEERIAAVLPLASKQVKAMIELQLVSGARPGEICAMRGCDHNTTGKYRLRSHKTAHDGHDRVLYLGPRAREIVRPFLKPGLAAARDVMQSDDLRLMARKLTEMVAEMPKLDWTQRESVRADLRCKVRRLLAIYGYPPDLSEDATQLVLKQAELSAGSGVQ